MLGVFSSTLLVTFFVRRAAFALGIVDVPDGGRKKHAVPVALLGGVALVLGIIPMVLALLYTTTIFTSGALKASSILAALLGGVILVVGGVIDDKKNLPPWIAIASPLFACALAVCFGIGFEKITNPLGGFFVIPQVAGVMMTFIWLLCMTYTTKLLDGVDGLSSSVSLVAACVIVALALSERFYQPDVAMLASLFAAGVGGFLLWNMPPAKIYLGEGGSTFLGFMLGILAVIGGSKTATLLFVVGLPMLDVAFVACRRFLRSNADGFWKRLRACTVADRTHLHLRLMDRGWGAGRVVALYIGVGALFGLASLLFSSWEKILAFVLLSCLSLWFMKNI